jgi:hypothetical protein
MSRLADKFVGTFLAQFCLKGLNERNQDLSPYLGLSMTGMRTHRHLSDHCATCTIDPIS